MQNTLTGKRKIYTGCNRNLHAKAKMRRHGKDPSWQGWAVYTLYGSFIQYFEIISYLHISVCTNNAVLFHLQTETHWLIDQQVIDCLLIRCHPLHDVQHSDTVSFDRTAEEINAANLDLTQNPDIFSCWVTCEGGYNLQVRKYNERQVATAISFETAI